MTFLKSLSVTVLTLALFAGAAFAQGQQPPQMPDLPTSEDVTDEEISLLVVTLNDLGPIEEKAQQRIEEAVESEDISFARFREMMMAMQNPQMAGEADITDEEMTKIQNLQPKLMEIQGETEQEMIAKIEDNGMSIQRYQDIIMGAQQDPQLMQRLQDELGIE